MKNKNDKQNTVLDISKPKHTKRNLAIKAAGILAVGVWVCGAALARPRPTAKKMDQNINQIRQIAPSNFDLSYLNLMQDTPVLNCFSRTLYMPKFKDKIDVYISLDLTDSQKVAVDYTISLLNNVNAQTFTNVPPIVLHYGKNKLDAVGINVVEKDLDDHCHGMEYGHFDFLSTNGIYHMFPVIQISSEVKNNTSNPTNLSAVLLHELMHAIYGLDDNYSSSNNIATNNNGTSTIMNGSNYTFVDFLTLNDIYAINAICWDKPPTTQQLEQIQQFYKKFQLQNTICSTPVKQYIIQLSSEIDKQ